MRSFNRSQPQVGISIKEVEENQETDSKRRQCVKKGQME